MLKVICVEGSAGEAPLSRVEAEGFAAPEDDALNSKDATDARPEIRGVIAKVLLSVAKQSTQENALRPAHAG
ncbi:hypothetical protein [Acidovorax sp. BLS4]|uniref:hypothetical protein n=1 Tax=Acidovorax sp. BLS4 TaxID=3273430 RepID=UPI002943C7E0|nr:hypothetical protein [Paracidovorax avenae]WOI44803.1 hypothetical protein R1Z03_20115 [Paracidovorax avenae]